MLKAESNEKGSALMDRITEEEKEEEEGVCLGGKLEDGLERSIGVSSYGRAFNKYFS